MNYLWVVPGRPPAQVWRVTTIGDCDDLPAEANARLIAAAPCMFAELIRLRNKLTAYMESEGFIYGAAADDIKSIDAILTKSGGEQ